MNQSLLASAAEKQRTQVDLNFLQTELSQLYVQTSEQRSNKQQLNHDLITLRNTNVRWKQSYTTWKLKSKIVSNAEENYIILCGR